MIDRSRRRRLSIGVIVVIAVLEMLAQIIGSQDRGRVLANIVLVLVGMPITMLAFSRFFSWTTHRRLGSTATLFAGVLLAGITGLALGFGIYLLGTHMPTFSPRGEGWRISRALMLGFVHGLVNYGLWTLAFVFPFAIEDARVRSLESDKLRLEAEQLRIAAELAQLRAHLEPHFLLNTLSAIAGLVTEDPKEARRLIACLGDLLRDALRNTDEMQRLDDQIGWLQRYAEILESRHPHDIAFRWEIDDRSREVMLPRLLLQPLLENAVKHGALKRDGGGTIVVRARLDDDKLVCTIEDNGPGVPSEIRSGAFGLHAVRRRLELRYLDRAHLRLESTDAGTRSIVEVPS